MTRSDRYIETSATCEISQVKMDFPYRHPPADFTPPPPDLTITVELEDGSQVNVTLPNLNPKGSIYISWVNKLGEHNIVDCGPGCGRMIVIKFAEDDILNPWLYRCQSTVHEVQGAVLHEEKLGDNVALLAATSLSRGFDSFDSGPSSSLQIFYDICTTA